MEKETVESKPFKVTPKVTVSALIFIVALTWYGSEQRSADITRIASLEHQCERMSDQLEGMKADIKIHGKDINSINVQYARIETKLAEISVNIVDLRKTMR